MTEFEIYFHGLVCLYAPVSRGDDPMTPKTMALFVRDEPDHDRSITTSDKITRFPRFNSISMTVIGGTPGVIDATDADFQKAVPHLGTDDISRGGAFVDPTLAIPLVFPPVAGRLFVAKRFGNQGEYQLAQRSSVRDVAKITYLSITAERLFITCDGQTIEIDPSDAGSWVCLFNNSQEGGYSTANNICGNHFRRYSFIMRSPNGDPANCAAVAHVVDHVVGPPPTTTVLRGRHIGTVAALRNVKSDDEQPTPIPHASLRPLQREGDREDTGDILDVDAAAQLRLHPDTIMQTQCSNTNWP